MTNNTHSLDKTVFEVAMNSGFDMFTFVSHDIQAALDETAKRPVQGEVLEAQNGFIYGFMAAALGFAANRVGPAFLLGSLDAMRMGYIEAYRKKGHHVAPEKHTGSTRGSRMFASKIQLVCQRAVVAATDSPGQISYDIVASRIADLMKSEGIDIADVVMALAETTQAANLATVMLSDAAEHGDPDLTKTHFRMLGEYLKHFGMLSPFDALRNRNLRELAAGVIAKIPSLLSFRKEISDFRTDKH